MTESIFNRESSDETAAQDGSLREDAPPEFGLVDVIEAFTAMRHEWRGQTKQSRAVAESIHTAVTAIQGLEAKLLAPIAGSSTDEARKLAEAIAETDLSLTRAVAAAAQWDANRKHRDESDTEAVERYFEGMHALARWLARPLLRFVLAQRQANEQTSENPANEGLSLVLARLRHMMKAQQIERIETLGRAFDANSMNAIGTIDSKEYPSGHVAEQLSPCYRWRGQLLRFADVRVTT